MNYKSIIITSLYGLLFVILYKIFFVKMNEPFQTYNQCRNLGYSKEFCVQTPSSVFGPAGCMCPDGTMGQTYPGLRGGCMCHRFNHTYIY